MGGGASRPTTPPPPSKYLDEPWRKIPWGDKPRLLQQLKDRPPEGQQLRILLYGPAGAGKSSFINAVTSIMKGRMSVQALAATNSTSCFTKEYTTYSINKGAESYPFVFNDIMGLGPNAGIMVDDIELILKGHVKNGYRFNPESSLAEGDRFYNESPTLSDRVHVLVGVVPADGVSRMDDKTKKKIQDIRLAATKLHIPQVAIITKIDDVSPEIKKSLKDVYKVKYLKEKMEEFSVNVGLPMNCIFPVKNYDKETDLDDDTDSLILNALMNILNFAEDNINFQLSQSESSP